jgi:hypothetical protein
MACLNWQKFYIINFFTPLTKGGRDNCSEILTQGSWKMAKNSIMQNLGLKKLTNYGRLVKFDK